MFLPSPTGDFSKSKVNSFFLEKTLFQFEGANRYKGCLSHPSTSNSLQCHVYITCLTVHKLVFLCLVFPSTEPWLLEQPSLSFLSQMVHR